MTKRPRFDWKRHLPEIRQMLENGATGAEVARHYGLHYTAALAGIKRHGLTIDPEASNAARLTALPSAVRCIDCQQVAERGRR